MVQTQLASMFIGNPYLPDAEDRLKGVSSLLSAQIHVIDGQSDHGIILDYITAKDIIEDEHKKSFEETIETYDFTTYADRSFSEHLEKRNRLIIPDDDGTLREFVIFESAMYLDHEGRKVDVYANASYEELSKAAVIYPDSYKGTASQHGGRALNETGWQLGIVEGSGNITISNDNYLDPLEKLKRIAREFELELRFRVVHDGNNIVGRYVDMLEHIGDWRGREITFGKDLDGIRRVESQDIVTALLGIGPEDSDGNRIEVLVEDEDALKRWGRVDKNGKIHHLIEAYEIESDRGDEMTREEARQYTRTALNKRINTQVTYETTVIDLENVPGMENKKIRFGDTIRIKDEGFNPPLYVEARVFEQSRSIKTQAKKNIKLGDYVEYTEEEVNAIWLMLQQEIKKKIDVKKLEEYAEMKRIESDTPPEIREGENPIWVDTSKTPKVSNVVIAGRWEKMTPTTPGEVDAYNKQEIDNKDKKVRDEAEEDAKKKAEQALEDAKAFSRNAENIDDGYIDVDAVPIRTSITGARIEWDGVNGLVQYNRDGDKTNWMNLDGEFYATNGHFSGDVTGSTGTFGEVVAKDGDFTIEDENTETKVSAVPKLNLVVDHSFEMVREYGSINNDGVFETLFSETTWYDVGSPRLSSIYQTSLPDSYALFGLKSILVNSSNYVKQDIYVDGNEDYTLSAHVAKQVSYNAGIMQLKVEFRDGDHKNIGSDITKNFPKNNSVNNMKRYGVTFKTPSNVSYISISVKSSNSSWVMIDGVQLVNGKIPSIYESEDSLSHLSHGLVTGRNISSLLMASNAIDIHTGTHFYARPRNNGKLRVTSAGTTGDWRPVEASSFDNKSQAELKQDIELWDGSAIDLINSADIYKYRLKSDVKNGYDKYKYSLVIGDGYKTPNEFLSVDDDAVDIYVQSNINSKGIQELSEMVSELKEENKKIKRQIRGLNNAE